MHYYEDEQLKENTLTLVIYIHEVCEIVKGKVKNKNKTDIEVTSIHKCKYFPPHLLYRILNKPNKFFKDIPVIKILKSEEYYKVELKAIGWGNDGKGEVSIKSIDNVTWDKDMFHQLH